MKHEDLIRDALNGITIEVRRIFPTVGEWTSFGKDVRLAVANMAQEYPSYEYRREPVPDIVCYRVNRVGNYNGMGNHQCLGVYPVEQAAVDFGNGEYQLKFSYDGFTKKLKKVEMVNGNQKT